MPSPNNNVKITAIFCWQLYLTLSRTAVTSPWTVSICTPTRTQRARLASSPGERWPPRPRALSALQPVLTEPGSWEGRRPLIFFEFDSQTIDGVQVEFIFDFILSQNDDIMKRTKSNNKRKISVLIWEKLNLSIRNVIYFYQILLLAQEQLVSHLNSQCILLVYFHINCRWTTINTSWFVSSSAVGVENARRVQSSLVPLPWPLRGISSSLQGVWQASSPINRLSSAHLPNVDKALFFSFCNNFLPACVRPSLLPPHDILTSTNPPLVVDSIFSPAAPRWRTSPPPQSPRPGTWRPPGLGQAHLTLMVSIHFHYVYVLQHSKKHFHT